MGWVIPRVDWLFCRLQVGGLDVSVGCSVHLFGGFAISTPSTLCCPSMGHTALADGVLCIW